MKNKADILKEDYEYEKKLFCGNFSIRFLEMLIVL